MNYFVIFFVSLIAILLAGCTAQPQQPDVNQPAQGEQMIDGMMEEIDEIMDDEMMQQPEVQEFTLTASKWKFDPSTIKVKQGTKVKLMIKSVDVDHGFALREYNIDVRLTPGRTETVEFIADKPGTFEFSCSVFCGSGHSSMQGTLIVE